MNPAIARPRLPLLAGCIRLALMALLPLGVALAAQSVPPAEGPVAAVFPPWWNGGSTFAAAASAGPVLRFGALPFIVVVGAPDRARVRAAGAWLLLDPRALSACAPGQPDAT